MPWATAALRHYLRIACRKPTAVSNPPLAVTIPTSRTAALTRPAQRALERIPSHVAPINTPSPTRDRGAGRCTRRHTVRTVPVAPQPLPEAALAAFIPTHAGRAR